MKQVKRILAPTDLSENSRTALSHAFSLAEESAAKLIILHVAAVLQAWELHFDDTGFPDPDLHPWPVNKAIQEATLRVDRFLERHAAEARRVAWVDKRVVVGDVADKIIEVAREEGADLIVVAPRPRGPFKQFFLGSITDSVVREAPCPVLTVSPPRDKQPFKGRLIPALWSSLRHREESI